MTGFESIHSNIKEDRKFKVKCCTYHCTCLKDCFHTSYIGDFQIVNHYSLPDQQFVHGVYSVFDHDDNDDYE